MLKPGIWFNPGKRPRKPAWVPFTQQAGCIILSSHLPFSVITSVPSLNSAQNNASDWRRVYVSTLIIPHLCCRYPPLSHLNFHPNLFSGKMDHFQIWQHSSAHYFMTQHMTSREWVFLLISLNHVFPATQLSLVTESDRIFVAE